MKESVLMEVITPILADEILKGNTNNRKIKVAKVSQFASDICAGQWKLNGDTIRIAKDGTLLDGQHRLLAVVLADRSVRSFVVRNLKNDVMNTIDRGTSRTAADVFVIQGEKNSVQLASTLRGVIAIKKGLSLNSISPSQHELETTLEQFPLVRKWCSRTKSAKRWLRSTFGSVSTLAAVKYGEDVVDRMFDEIENGTYLAPHSPILLLRDKSDRWSRKEFRGEKVSSKMLLDFYITVVNRYCNGMALKRFSWSVDKATPKI